MSTYHLYEPVQAWKAIQAAWQHIKPAVMQGARLELIIRPERRSTDQNAKLWAMLGEVSEQVNWYGEKLSAEDWKHIFSASLKKQRAVPGIDGGFVVLGQRTSKMSKAELSDLIELIYIFCADKNVKFSNFEKDPL